MSWLKEEMPRLNNNFVFQMFLSFSNGKGLPKGGSFSLSEIFLRAIICFAVLQYFIFSAKLIRYD